MPAAVPPTPPPPGDPPGGPDAEGRLAVVARAARVAPRSEPLRRLVHRAADLLRVPVAMVSLVAGDREVVAAAVGLPEPWASAGWVPLSHSLCAQVVHHDGAVVLFDARLDPEYRHHPVVVDLGAGAYAGYPLRHGGHVLGAFCALDTTARRWSEEDLRLLEDLTAAATSELGAHLDAATGRSHP